MNVIVSNPARTAATVYLITKNAKQITWTPRREGDLFYMFDEKISDNPNYETQQYESFGSALIVADKSSSASQIAVSVEYRATFNKMSGTPFILTVSYSTTTPASIDDIAVEPVTTGAVTTYVNDYTVATAAQDTLSFPVDVTPVPTLSGTYGYYFYNGPTVGARLISPSWSPSNTMLTLTSNDIPSGTTVQLFYTFMIHADPPASGELHLRVNGNNCPMYLGWTNTVNNEYYGVYAGAVSGVFPVLFDVHDANDQSVSFGANVINTFLFWS